MSDFDVSRDFLITESPENDDVAQSDSGNSPSHELAPENSETRNNVSPAADDTSQNLSEDELALCVTENYEHDPVTYADCRKSSKWDEWKKAMDREMHNLDA